MAVFQEHTINLAHGQRMVDESGESRSSRLSQCLPECPSRDYGHCVRAWQVRVAAVQG